MCDGNAVDLGDVKYLLSPQDLAAYALVPDLIAAGVCSLKIEGRLKTPEYVANITRHYRQAIDTAVAGRPVEFTPRAVEEMEFSFRAVFPWLAGRAATTRNSCPACRSAKHGVLVARVLVRGRGQRVEVDFRLAQPRRRRRVRGRSRRGREQGGRVFEIFRGPPVAHQPDACQGIVESNLRPHGRRLPADFRLGQPIVENRRARADAAAAQIVRLRDKPQRRMPLEPANRGPVGEPLQITARSRRCPRHC